ncbi:MAG: response regulator [Acidobacteriota bacterium]
MICYPVKVLVVEDNADQLLLTERALKRFNSEMQVTSVRTGRECLDRLAREYFSVVIMDYSLPEMNGMEVMERIRQGGRDVPVVMVTGQGDEQIAVQAMKAGAYDYVVKTQGYLKSLPGIVEKTIEKYDLESKLKVSEEKYKRLAENANDLIFTTDVQRNFTFLTRKVSELLGYSAEELIGQNVDTVLTEDSRSRVLTQFNVDPSQAGTRLVEFDFATKSGERKSFELSLTALIQGGRLAGFEAIGRDVTQRKLLEGQLVQKNKELTALVSAATAIAHSLNVGDIAAAGLEKVVEFSGLEFGALFTLGFSDGELTLSASHNASEPVAEMLRDKALWEELLPLLSRTYGPMTDGPQESSKAGIPAPLAAAFNQRRLRSWVVFPLRFKEKLLGFVFLGGQKRHQFSGQEMQILVSLCSQVSVAVANARLFTAIREAKTEWETTFDAMSELICMQDLNGKIIRVNRALARRIGIEPRDLVNRTAESVFVDNDKLSPWCHPQKAGLYEPDKIVSVEYEDRMLNGTFEVSTTPIYTSDGRHFAWLFVGKDITEQVQLQNQFVQVERLKALGEMASGVAHDFNNILAGILGKTQLLLSKLEKSGSVDSTSLKQELKVIERTSVQGAQTVKRIQDFTRIRTDQKFSPVDLNRIVQEAIDVLRPLWKDQAEARGLKIDLVFHPGEISPVHGIDSELNEVVRNIISNAIDALPDGGIIEVSTSRTDINGEECVEIRIRDSGIGMSTEVKRKIFDPFFSTKGPKGTGLGMSVVYGIISRHHGNITVESELGKGTTCLAYLPVVKQPAKTARARTPTMDQQKVRILVIDDEDVIRDFLVEMFVAAGYESESASNGPEGIRLFEKNRYDLVFSDLGLPEMSGWDVARALKDRRPDIPIVLLSGWGIQLDDVRIKESGIDLVLSKPCQMEELLGAVDEVLKRNRRQSA